MEESTDAETGTDGVPYHCISATSQQNTSQIKFRTVA
jgi:hypothetical protein